MTHPQFVPPHNDAPSIISAHVLSTSDEAAPAESGQAHAIIEEAQAVLDEAHADIAEAKSDLIHADAGLDEAQAELDEAEEELAVVTEATEDAAADGYDDDDDDYEDFLDDDIEQLRPGDIDETIIAVWDPDVAERYRDAFRDIQAHFVDEPEAALGEAQDLVAEAVQALADALLAEQVSLDPHEQDANPDTEAMRIAMRGYREFLDRVLAL
jgi:chromosome segregation ATPase